VLKEVLTIDHSRRGIRERQRLPNIESNIRELAQVDIDPAQLDILAATDVQFTRQLDVAVDPLTITMWQHDHYCFVECTNRRHE
jgi:hypothetical protein